MNKYDDLINRAQMFRGEPMIGELINAVRELKERPEVVRCKHCVFCEENECTYPRNGIEEKVPEISKHYRIRVFPKVEENHFCGYGRRELDAVTETTKGW